MTVLFLKLGSAEEAGDVPILKLLDVLLSSNTEPQRWDSSAYRDRYGEEYSESVRTDSAD